MDHDRTEQTAAAAPQREDAGAAQVDALVIGGGPAGLMAAEALLWAGRDVVLVDAKPSLGRKFLMAGKSGLNLTKAQPIGRFLAGFGDASEALRPMLSAFTPDHVRDWARDLGAETFVGSTGRVFPVAMKASPLLRAWQRRLLDLGLDRRTRWRWLGWDGEVCRFDTPDGPRRVAPRVTVLALGGASWARLGSDGAWAAAFRAAGLPLSPFAPSNSGLRIEWTDHMRPHFGAPLKTIALRAGALISRGEAVISARGLEGGGVYALTPALRDGARLQIDLAPDLDLDALRARLSTRPGKVRLSHWLKNGLRLPPAKVALFLEMTAGETLARARWAETLKALPIRDAGLRPIDEAISTAGGVPFEALDAGLMLRRRPGVFCAGEMLDWEAPTGGYLLTACLATGLWAGRHAASHGR